MKKIVKISESDLMRIVKRVISEQNEENEKIKNPVYLMGDYVTDLSFDMSDEDDEDAMSVEEGYLMGIVDYDELKDFGGKEPEIGTEYDILDGTNIYLFKMIGYEGRAYNEDFEAIEPEISDGFTQGILTVVPKEQFYHTLRRIH